ncbi:TRAP transporter small permease [Thalassorhabdomicrobium marinisediminis]|uniref:TRAP transporter small permease n=1 Tax=Thalassorhabdomicrobium marinisediminis TaxID=2170577 RepID=UPI002493B6BD|nr:TRAP transporter small permease [Thalassorhabdomicrobium marinisediminis]
MTLQPASPLDPRFGLLWHLKLKLLRAIMGITTIGFTVLVFIQVVVRYFFDFPLFGVEEIAAYLAVWLYFIGSAYGAYKDNHISASVMDLFVSKERGRNIVGIIVALVSIVISAYTFWICTKYFQWSLQRVPKSPELKIPLGYTYVSMVIGLGLMVFYYLIELVLRVRALSSGTPFEPLAGSDLSDDPEHAQGL